MNVVFYISDLDYLARIFPPSTEASFFDYLEKLDLSGVTIWAIDEGSSAFPDLPLLVVKGPLVVCQLLETPLLNLINYAR